jgi:hypothetical protein
MDLERLRRERPDLFLKSDERELVTGFDEPPDEVREAFLDALPSLIQIYHKKREAIVKHDPALWKSAVSDEVELIGMGTL